MLQCQLVFACSQYSTVTIRFQSAYLFFLFSPWNSERSCACMVMMRLSALRFPAYLQIFLILMLTQCLRRRRRYAYQFSRCGRAARRVRSCPPENPVSTRRAQKERSPPAGFPLQCRQMSAGREGRFHTFPRDRNHRAAVRLTHHSIRHRYGSSKNIKIKII